MKMQESAEMYLETVFVLQKRLGFVRAIDIANELSYSKPSVSIAMKNLRENGYIRLDADGSILLTEAGALIAQSVYDRHTTISTLLIRLGVDPAVAAEDACRIEHVISEETFGKLKDYIDNTEA